MKRRRLAAKRDFGRSDKIVFHVEQITPVQGTTAEEVSVPRETSSGKYE